LRWLLLLSDTCDDECRKLVGVVGRFLKPLIKAMHKSGEYVEHDVVKTQRFSTRCEQSTMKNGEVRQSFWLDHRCDEMRQTIASRKADTVKSWRIYFLAANALERVGLGASLSGRQLRGLGKDLPRTVGVYNHTVVRYIRVLDYESSIIANVLLKGIRKSCTRERVYVEFHCLRVQSDTVSRGLSDIPRIRRCGG
jgi:hypothetical protein